MVPLQEVQVFLQASGFRMGIDLEMCQSVALMDVTRRKVAFRPSASSIIGRFVGRTIWAEAVVADGGEGVEGAVCH
jgi:hypothetical protein